MNTETKLMTSAMDATLQAMQPEPKPIDGNGLFQMFLGMNQTEKESFTDCLKESLESVEKPGQVNTYTKLRLATLQSRVRRLNSLYGSLGYESKGVDRLCIERNGNQWRFGARVYPDLCEIEEDIDYLERDVEKEGKLAIV